MELGNFLTFYQSLDADSVSQLPDYYAGDAELIDPINHARGIAEVEMVFADLFKQLQDIEFRIAEAHQVGEHIHMVWDMDYRFRGKARTLAGATHLRLGEHGLIVWQRDYWDATHGVYGEFPLLGFALRKIRKMVQVCGD